MANTKRTTKKKTSTAKAATKKVSKNSNGGKKNGRAKPPKKALADLDALRKVTEEAQVALEQAETEAAAMAEKARTVVRDAKAVYRAAVTPYREACRSAGVECDFAGARRADVAERVRFEVEHTKKGVRVAIVGRPETEEVIPLAELEKSVNKAAYGYTDRWLGPREEIGNKGGGLSNRLRTVMKKK